MGFFKSLKGLSAAIKQVETLRERVGVAGVLTPEGAAPHPSGGGQTIAGVAASLEYRKGGDAPLRTAFAEARPALTDALVKGVQEVAAGRTSADAALKAPSEALAAAYKQALTEGGHIVTGTTVAAVRGDVRDASEVKL
jgi:hypothetical protein